IPMNSEAPRRSSTRSGEQASRRSLLSTMNRIVWKVVSAAISVVIGRAHVTSVRLMAGDYTRCHRRCSLHQSDEKARGARASPGPCHTDARPSPPCDRGQANAAWDAPHHLRPWRSAAKNIEPLGGHEGEPEVTWLTAVAGPVPL